MPARDGAPLAWCGPAACLASAPPSLPPHQPAAAVCRTDRANCDRECRKRAWGRPKPADTAVLPPCRPGVGALASCVRRPGASLMPLPLPNASCPSPWPMPQPPGTRAPKHTQTLRVPHLNSVQCGAPLAQWAMRGRGRAGGAAATGTPAATSTPAAPAAGAGAGDAGFPSNPAQWLASSPQLHFCHPFETSKTPINSRPPDRRSTARLAPSSVAFKRRGLSHSCRLAFLASRASASPPAAPAPARRRTAGAA
jgi:hypothetical protein